MVDDMVKGNKATQGTTVKMNEVNTRGDEKRLRYERYLGGEKQ